VATGLSGCSGGGSGGAATTPSERPAEARAADPSAGIVRYQTYSAIVVGQGDTVSDLARRAGVDQQALASYNGIEVTTQLRPGDELVLPPG
jgi:LysM repeat protein